MSLKTDIDQFVTDVALVHSWAQGSSSTSVTMGGASVRSPAKLIADYSTWLTTNMQALGTVDPANVLFTGGSISEVAGGFTTLTASGLATFNGKASVAAGSVSLPGLYFSTDNATGFYRIGANNIGYSVNGTKLLDLSAALFAVAGVISSTASVTSPTFTSVGSAGVQQRALFGSGTTTAACFSQFTNTSGNAYFGVEGATPGAINAGASPYDTCINSASTRGISFSCDNGASNHARLSSTVFAVTAAISATGNITSSGGGFVTSRTAGTEFTQALLNLSSGGTGMVQAYNGAGGGWNAAAAALLVTKNTTTSRSINAAGTVNASGADYAEYERNNGLTITKGDVVGFKADGTLTDLFSEAIRFGVKSTDPSYVGGDVWGTEAQVGARPVEPAFAEPAYAGSAEPQLAPQPVTPEAALPAMPVQQTDEAAGTFDMRMAAWQQQCAEILAAHDAAMAQYQTAMAAWQPLKDAYDLALAQHQADMAAHAAAVAAAQLEFDTVTYPAYQADLVAFEGRLEAARQLVDRIAYSGKVPVNVIGAIPGDYLVALAAADGGITATPVADPTFAQYKLAIGRVNRILPDGRAEVAVMVH